MSLVSPAPSPRIPFHITCLLVFLPSLAICPSPAICFCPSTAFKPVYLYIYIHIYIYVSLSVSLKSQVGVQDEIVRNGSSQRKENHAEFPPEEGLEGPEKDSALVSAPREGGSEAFKKDVVLVRVKAKPEVLNQTHILSQMRRFWFLQQKMEVNLRPLSGPTRNLQGPPGASSVCRRFQESSEHS